MAAPFLLWCLSLPLLSVLVFTAAAMVAELWYHKPLAPRERAGSRVGPD